MSEPALYNVHKLIHAADDVTIFGPLESFSAFVFENFLGVKKILRKKGNHYNRLLSA